MENQNATFVLPSENGWGWGEEEQHLASWHVQGIGVTYSPRAGKSFRLGISGTSKS